MKIVISILIVSVIIVIGYLSLPTEQYLRISDEYDGKTKYEVKLLIKDWENVLDTAGNNQSSAILQYLSDEYNIADNRTACQIIDFIPYDTKYLLIQAECTLIQGN